MRQFHIISWSIIYPEEKQWSPLRTDLFIMQGFCIYYAFWNGGVTCCCGFPCFKDVVYFAVMARRRGPGPASNPTNQVYEACMCMLAVGFK